MWIIVNCPFKYDPADVSAETGREPRWFLQMCPTMAILRGRNQKETDRSMLCPCSLGACLSYDGRMASHFTAWRRPLPDSNRCLLIILSVLCTHRKWTLPCQFPFLHLQFGYRWPLLWWAENVTSDIKGSLLLFLFFISYRQLLLTALPPTKTHTPNTTTTKPTSQSLFLPSHFSLFLFKYSTECQPPCSYPARVDPLSFTVPAVCSSLPFSLFLLLGSGGWDHCSVRVSVFRTQKTGLPLLSVFSLSPHAGKWERFIMVSGAFCHFSRTSAHFSNVFNVCAVKVRSRAGMLDGLYIG